MKVYSNLRKASLALVEYVRIDHTFVAKNASVWLLLVRGSHDNPDQTAISPSGSVYHGVPPDLHNYSSFPRPQSSLA